MARKDGKTSYQVLRERFIALEAQNAELHKIINQQAAHICKLTSEVTDREYQINTLEKQKVELLDHMGFIRRIGWWLKQTHKV